jgi:hypothetical protein
MPWCHFEHSFQRGEVRMNIGDDEHAHGDMLALYMGEWK